MSKSYQFEKNLLKLSNSTTFNEAKNEWYFIDKDKSDICNKLCICNHKVKNINYFYNIITLHTIICGVICCKKFNFQGKKINNKILLDILKNNLKVFEADNYYEINDLFEYSKTIKNYLIEYFTEKINKDDIKLLNEQLENINDLIDNYNIVYLEEIKNKILLYINEIKEKNIQKDQQMSELSSLMAQINDLKKQAEKILENKKLSKLKIYYKQVLAQYFYYKNDDDKKKIQELYRKTLDYRQKYVMVTCTFDPKIAFNYDTNGLFTKCEAAMSKLDIYYKHYTCYEMHKSKVLHIHTLIECDDIHKLKNKLLLMKSYFTEAIRLEPSIKFSFIKENAIDIDRTYNYIWEHKKDHPEYKYIKISI